MHAVTERPVVLVDTSAWVEYLRGTGSPVDETLRASIAVALRDGLALPAADRDLNAIVLETGLELVA